ncbi:hypothetical protein C8034_v001100 [Colletotrichum sidae]|uniref:AA1-like domain-containing protein n=3 Tax=Colletotrichum orbiculare species complex TaxID=2707354 RepID=N4UQX8_COLOR|nr:hypothetical protein Cob_v002691 [Colletotrichum orbiculare MAFF 240422]TDZ74430.1 hypothetical protein CTRI78_v000837 [Colletotrichum trifolii]TEA16406.1 hypothetical protein C8034_v001100 [Colletotrichum sidae]
MKVSLVLIAAHAAQAAVSYLASVPESLMAKVASSGCTLPAEYQILNFKAQSPDGGKTFDFIDFGFNDKDTAISTHCYLNATSVPVPGDGRADRYPCEDERVQFIWKSGSITAVEKACPGADGKEQYEAAGTAIVAINCDGAANATTGRSRRTRRANVGCKSTSDIIQARFFSLQPVPGG